jgi:molecular chaperone GrpE
MTDTPGRAEETAPETDPGATPETDPTADLKRQVAELDDRWRRALAETENLRRRAERDVADARIYGIVNFAREVVGVADNMTRAMQALDDEIRGKVDAGVKALLDGVELTERELLNVLEKHGVKKIEPLGQKFDPNLHQAMFEVPDPSVPSGTVVQVVQSGYTIGERLLRPAMVGVAKGGPKTPAAEARSESEAPANDNSGTDKTV